MTLITPDENNARTEELLSSVQETLRELRSAFKALKRRVDAGEDVKATELRGKLNELTTAVGNCQKLETSLDDARRKHGQIARGDYALDLEAARAQVRCSLGRLRACCGAGDVSG